MQKVVKNCALKDCRTFEKVDSTEIVGLAVVILGGDATQWLHKAATLNRCIIDRCRPWNLNGQTYPPVAVLVRRLSPQRLVSTQSSWISDHRRDESSARPFSNCTLRGLRSDKTAVWTKRNIWGGHVYQRYLCTIQERIFVLFRDMNCNRDWNCNRWGRVSTTSLFFIF